MTWGTIRYELTRAYPGVDLELLTAWIREAYEAILDYRKWSGLRGEASLVTSAPTRTGTVSLIARSNVVTGVGTAFAIEQDGWRFRPVERAEYYTVLVASATELALDRPYEGPSATNAPYRLWQAVYPLPADVKVLRAITGLQRPGPLAAWTGPRLDATAPNRPTLGSPTAYVPRFVEMPGGLVHEVELYPAPDRAEGLQLEYELSPVGFDGSNTEDAPLPWVSVAAIKAHAAARILSHLDKPAAAAAKDAEYLAALMQMSNVENRRAPQQRMKMDPAYTRHRIRRWTR